MLIANTASILSTEVNSGLEGDKTMKLTLFEGRKKMKVRPSYSLTPLGRVKAEELRLTGAKGIVASAIEELESATVREISEKTSMQPERVKEVLKMLAHEGYVRQVSNEE